MSISNKAEETTSSWNKYSAGVVRIWENLRSDLEERGWASMSAAEAIINLYRRDIYEFIQNEREDFRYGCDDSVDVLLYLRPDKGYIDCRISKSALCCDDELAVLRIEINRRRLWEVTEPYWVRNCFNRFELIELASNRTMEYGYAPSAEEHIENQLRDTISTMNEEITSDSTAQQLYISFLNGYIPLSSLDGAPKRAVISAEYTKLLDEDGWADMDMFLQLVGEDIFNKHFRDAMFENNHSREALFARLEDVKDYLDPEETAICTRAIQHIKMLDEKLLTT